MDKMKMLKLAGLSFLGAIVLALIMQGAHQIARDWNLIDPPIVEQNLLNVNHELMHYKIASRINDYYYRFDEKTRVQTIVEVLDSLDIYMKRYFPKGPFNKRDMLALAMVESGFSQYLTGTRKEYGIFQIMPESSKWMGVERNQFNIRVNTELALFVLKKKYDEHKEYKMAIIAYNGIVKRRGKISEKYWNKFIKYRRAIDDILREYPDNL